MPVNMLNSVTAALLGQWQGGAGSSSSTGIDHGFGNLIQGIGEKPEGNPQQRARGGNNSGSDASKAGNDADSVATGLLAQREASGADVPLPPRRTIDLLV